MSVPRFERIDPQFAYPDIHNGRLVDLLVIQQLKLRTARLLFPAENFDEAFSNAKDTDDITIMDYYGPTFNARALGRTGTDGGKMDPGKVHLIDYWQHGCDRIPVGFAMLPSPTGEFHGSLDQVGPAMSTKNRLVNLITEYAHEGIYAPWEERGILNWNEDPGPDTRYHHNPNLDGDTFMRRLSPASFNGELFSLLQFLETEQRGQMGYPAARQGDVTQSIVSNAGIMGMQGQLQSIVKERMRLLTQVQSNLAAVAFQLDKNELLDFEKPLPALVGNKRAYLPSRDIGDKYDVRVMYGAGAGLDRLNADQRLINYKTIGVLSGETMLEQSDFIEDARGEMQRVQDEEIERILLQKWLSSPEVTPEVIGMTLKIKDNRGISLGEAWAEVQSQLADQMAAAQEAAAAAAPEAAVPGAPPAAVPGEAAPAPQPEFARTPLHQVIS